MAEVIMDKHSILSEKMTIVSEMHQLSNQDSDVLVMVVLSISFDNDVILYHFVGDHFP